MRSWPAADRIGTIFGVFSALMFVGGIFVFIAATTANMQISGILLIGFGLLIAGVAAILEQLRAIVALLGSPPAPQAEAAGGARGTEPARRAIGLARPLDVGEIGNKAQQCDCSEPK